MVLPPGSAEEAASAKPRRGHSAANSSSVPGSALALGLTGELDVGLPCGSALAPVVTGDVDIGAGGTPGPETELLCFSVCTQSS